jgi:flagellar L-ring protein precursor FlgH
VSRGLAAWLLLGVGAGLAQDSSLLRRGDSADGQPPSLDDSSFIYKELEPPKVLKLRDIVTVVVNINTRVLSEGEVDNRKQASLDAVLADWISFDNGDLVPDPQRRGSPRIGGKWNSRYRAEGDLETRDLLTFTIAATVVDILPNGNLVIEARRTVQNNDEVWEQSLTGVIRREDVSLDNKVESEDVAEMRIHKREGGQVRDAYRRGWFVKFFDKLQPI